MQASPAHVCGHLPMTRFPVVRGYSVSFLKRFEPIPLHHDLKAGKSLQLLATFSSHNAENIHKIVMTYPIQVPHFLTPPVCSS